MGDMTLTTPLSGIIFHQQADMANIIIYTKFEASLCTCHEDMKSRAKCKKWGDLGHLGVT